MIIKCPNKGCKGQSEHSHRYSVSTWRCPVCKVSFEASISCEWTLLNLKRVPTDRFTVVCFDDFGRLAVATHRLFDTEAQAEVYATGIDGSREPQVLRDFTFQFRDPVR
jgi:C4-type Zn-finger protein